MTFRSLHFAFICGALLLSGFSAGGSIAATVGDPQAGRATAQQLCADCHEIEAARVRAPTDEAASFQEIADTPGITRLALTAFFQTPHRNMPNLILSGDERDDLIAYILSLKSE